jgi:hypothetical protein
MIVVKKIATNVAVGLAAGFLVLAGGAAGNAVAPYGPSGSVAVNSPSPCAGTTITVQLSGFNVGETIDVYLGTASTPVQSVTAGSTGGATLTIAIPATDRGPLVVSAVGRTSELTGFASLTVLDCSRSGAGSLNTGDGNEGSDNIGDGNQGNSNRGDGNQGSNNIGNGNQSNGNIGDGNPALVEHDHAIQNSSGDHDSLAIWVGIGAAAAVSVAQRRRRRS